MADDLTPEETGLLNKAKQERHRRRRRRLVVGLGGSLLVVVGLLFAAFAYDLYWQHRVKAKDAQLRAQGKLLTAQEILARDKDLPPGKNSALVYLEAFRLLRDEKEMWVVDSLPASDPIGVRPSAQTVALISSEAKADSLGLETILRASSLEEGCYPLKPAASLWDLDLSYCQELRRAARLCSRVAVLHAAAGRPADAAPYLLAGLGLASSLGHKPLVIEVLVRIAADAIATSALERSLALCQLAPEDLKKLQAALDRERSGLSLGSALASERSAAHHAFERMVGDVTSALQGQGLSRWYGVVPGWRERDELFYDSAMDEMERIVALSPRQALAQMNGYSAALGPRMVGTFPRPVVSAILLEGLPRCLTQEAAAKMQLSVAAAGLAAERYRLKNGRWPEALEQLVPEFLDAVPEDFFAAGKVHYLRTETGVTVYSVGEDGHDDGGISLDEARNAGQSSAHDRPFRLLNPELRGAKTMTFREEVFGAHLEKQDLKAAGLDEDALKRLGLTDEDLKALR